MLPNYIIGYGSLINMDSISKTLRNLDNTQINILLVEILGMKRGWFVESSKVNFTALGVVKKLISKFNGTLIGPLSKKQINELDKREMKYRRIKIEKENVKIIKQNISIPRGSIWIYVAKNKKSSSNNCPIIQTYVDVIINSSLKLSKSFTEEFIKTTTNWNGIWINDRRSPIYQRAMSLSRKEENKIDKILKHQFPKSSKCEKYYIK